MDLIVDNAKINCPRCNSSNCFREDYKVEKNEVSSYMCMGCGYTTTSLYKKNSEMIGVYEEQCPDLFKDIKYHDKDTDLLWYPIVLNFPDKGLIFPDGTNAFDWQWRAVPVVKVDDSEKEKYPIPNKPGEYYETKADMENSRLYPQSSFQDACKYLKIIVE
jgi:transcription elongation factor Elf1